jgi:hypothetical protein
MRWFATKPMILNVAMVLCGCGDPTTVQPVARPDWRAAVTVEAASASTQVMTIPADQRLSPGVIAAIEACTGEPLTLVGDAVLVVHRTVLPDGARQLVIHSNPQGVVAVGTSSGTTYRFAASDVLARVIAPSGAFVTTFMANLWVIGDQGHPRFGGPILVHLTVTPSGDVTAAIEMLDKGFQCVV